MFAVVLPRHPTVLHAAEEGSPGSGGQGGGSEGGARLWRNPGCARKDGIHGAEAWLVLRRWVALTGSIGEAMAVHLRGDQLLLHLADVFRVDEVKQALAS